MSFDGIDVPDTASASVEALVVLLALYALGVALLFPIVCGLQRRASWCLLNLDGLRFSEATLAERSPVFRLVLRCLADAARYLLSVAQPLRLRTSPCGPLPSRVRAVSS